MISSASATSGWMSECKPYQYTEVTEYLPENEKTFSIGGQDYDEGYVFYLWNAARTSQVLYNLKGEYSNFSFYAGHVDGTKQYTAQLKIYLDGTLSETVPLTPDDIAKKITVNTDGVMSLKIKMTSDEELNHYDITYGIYGGTFTRNGTTAAAISNSNMTNNCEPYEFAGDKKKNKVIRSDERQEIFMGGDSYTDCLQFYLWNPNSDSQAKFNFNNNYESFSFLIGHIDDTSRYPVSFEFAADGAIVKKLDLEPDDLPVPVDISLSGVKQLTISMFSSQPDNTYDYYYGLGAIQLKSIASTGSGNDSDSNSEISKTDTPKPESTPSAPATSNGVTVTVDGKAAAWTDAVPFIDEHSRTMVPLRAVADAMSLTVNWDANAKEASFTNGNKTIIFPIGSTLARTNSGNSIQMNTAAVIVGGRTYAPIRYMAEFFGYQVDWDGTSRTVIITS